MLIYLIYSEVIVNTLFKQSETAEVGNTLRRFLCSLALSGAPLDSIEVTLPQAQVLCPSEDDQVIEKNH